MMSDFLGRDKLLTGEPTLVIMCGLSRTGKTTHANSLGRIKNCVVFGMDDVRRAMGQQYDLRHEPVVRTVKPIAVSALLHRGYTVIADDTHLDVRSRRDTMAFVRAMVPGVRIRINAVRVPEGADYDRWMQAVDRDQFPRDVIEYQMNRYEAPDEEIDGVPVDWINHRHGGDA